MLQSEVGASISKSGVGFAPLTVKLLVSESTQPKDVTLSDTLYTADLLYLRAGFLVVSCAGVYVGPGVIAGAPALKFHWYEKLVAPSAEVVLSLKNALASFKQTSGTEYLIIGFEWIKRGVASLNVSLLHPELASAISHGVLMPQFVYVAV